MGTNILNIQRASVWWWSYTLSNAWATFEAQFMKKLSNTDAELKKSVVYKKTCVLAKRYNLLTSKRPWSIYMPTHEIATFVIKPYIFTAQKMKLYITGYFSKID